MAEEEVMRAKVMQGTINKYITAGSSKPRWRYRLRLGKDPLTGIYMREGRGGYAKEGDARTAMRDRIAEITGEQNAPVEPPRPREVALGEWLTRWIDTYAVVRCQGKTIERYRQLATYVTTAKEGELAELARTPLSAVRRSQIKL